MSDLLYVSLMLSSSFFLFLPLTKLRLCLSEAENSPSRHSIWTTVSSIKEALLSTSVTLIGLNCPSVQCFPPLGLNVLLIVKDVSLCIYVGDCHIMNSGQHEMPL